MQFFKDAAGEIYAFAPDVVVQQVDGVYIFATAAGVRLHPELTTLTPYTPPAPTDAELLAAAQAERIGALTAACAAAITAGFTSSALGSPYTYGSTLTDQSNLQASVLRSLMPSLPGGWTTPFKCADAAGAWALREHTAAQIQQAGEDGMAMVVAAQQKLATLSAEVAAATTVAAVQAVAW